MKKIEAHRETGENGKCVFPCFFVGVGREVLWLGMPTLNKKRNRLGEK
ncbi:hypothetical protein JOC77_001797 [Peribacillus deserti]|uniref:Uncharacterized protein n=1 Tax=Peribacillus deserti TaxID=673318 RepID=A0ABS2QGX8_9BACI|nr:hypothetical protein [Peribacillus deserti]